MPRDPRTTEQRRAEIVRLAAAGLDGMLAAYPAEAKFPTPLHAAKLALDYAITLQRQIDRLEGDGY